MEISVVIPAYNEEENIRETVERSVEALRRLCTGFEVIIVDDMSTDRTGEFADELSGHYPEVRVIHNPKRLRQGGSLVVGFREARCNLVTHNAMDYPFHLEDLRMVLPLLERADVAVIARRSRPESSVYRRFLTSINLFLLQNCFGLRLKDYNFVQLYKRDVLTELRFDETSTGFLVPSLLFQAHYRGYRIAEVALDYWPRQKGKARSGELKVLLHTLRDLGRFWMRTWNSRRQLNQQQFTTNQV